MTIKYLGCAFNYNTARLNKLYDYTTEDASIVVGDHVVVEGSAELKVVKVMEVKDSPSSVNYKGPYKQVIVKVPPGWNNV